jgi:hypothetical protein
MSAATEIDDDYESFDQILAAIGSPDPRRRDHAALHVQELA